MNIERSFIKSFSIIGHPTKNEIIFAFHAFLEQGERYCKVLTINESIPEFIFKFNRGAWQLQGGKNAPVWFNTSEISSYLNETLINKA